MVTYSFDGKTPKGAWILFDDGHTEYWTDQRLQAELSHRGMDFLKTQIMFNRALLKQREKEIQEMKDKMFQ